VGGWNHWRKGALTAIELAIEASPYEDRRAQLHSRQLHHGSFRTNMTLVLNSLTDQACAGSLGIVAPMESSSARISGGSRRSTASRFW
jgi:hypothetical protein